MKKRMAAILLILAMLLSVITLTQPATVNAALPFEDNFNDGDAAGWQTYGGTWSVNNGRYKVQSGTADKSVIDAGVYFSNGYVMEGDITLEGEGESSLIFNVRAPLTAEMNGFTGYSAGINSVNDTVWIGKFDTNYRELSSTKTAINANTTYHLKVVVHHGDIKVFLNGDQVLHNYDSAFMNGGLIGTRGGFHISTQFDNIVVNPLPSSGVSNTEPAGASGICTGCIYKIRSEGSGKMLQVTDDSLSDGANVEQGDDRNNTSQQWQVIDIGQGSFHVINQHSGKSLEAAGSGTDNGVNVQQRTYEAEDNQQWTFEYIANGYYKIIGKQSGKALNVANGSVTEGGNVDIFDYVGLPNQNWKLEIVRDNGMSLVSGNFRLKAENDSPGRYGIAVYNQQAGGEVKHYLQSRPITVQIKDDSGKLNEYRGSYSSMVQSGNLLTAIGTITTENGSVFSINDTYSIYDGDGTFKLSRNVTVVSADNGDSGFGTVFGLHPAGSKNFLDYEYFIPGNLYDQNGYDADTGRNEYVEPQAAAGDFSHNYFWMRAPRLPLPLTMMRSKATGSTLTLLQAEALQPTTGAESSAWNIGNEYQYGSLGFHKSPVPTLDFVYPGSEGEKTYVDFNAKWARKGHPVQTSGVDHNYTVLMKVGQSNDYAGAMKEAWRFGYDVYDPAIKPLNVNTIYENAIETLDTYLREYNGDLGLPFRVNSITGIVDDNLSDDGFQDIHMQSGFVGQVLPAAYHLLKYGTERNNAAMATKAAQFLDWWAAQSPVQSSDPKINGMVKTEYDMLGHWWFPVPMILRVSTDGMEGVLDAYRHEKSRGIERTEWLAFARKYGDWLVNNQNNDGSYYRAYNANGDPINTTKANTVNPVRFLVELYQATGDNRYMNAATAAADFAYDTYVPGGVYLAGTADNPQQVILDKEGGIMALYAFLAMYDETNDDKWLEAAESAATYIDTWIFSYDFHVNPVGPHNPFPEAGIVGNSLVKTGISYVDMFAAYLSEPYYRLYLSTDDPYYLQQAKIFQHNVNQTADYDGRLGLAYKGLFREGMGMDWLGASFNSFWLPWCSVAQIDPLVRLEEQFGSMDILEIEQIDSYSVTYNGNGSTSGSVPVDGNSYDYNTNATVLGSIGNLTKAGYRFKGWNTLANGMGITYKSGDLLTIIADITLYAVWERIPTPTPTTTQSTSPTEKVRQINLEWNKMESDVARALKENKKMVTVVIDDDPEDPADQMYVTIPKDSYQKIANQEMDIQLKTKEAAITLPNDSLSNWVSSGEELFFRLTPIREEGDKKQLKHRTTNAAEVRLIVGDNDLDLIGTPMAIETNLQNQRVRLAFPIDANRLPADPVELTAFLNSLAVYIEHSDGEEVVQHGSIRYDENHMPVALEIEINKFSTFVMFAYEKEPIAHSPYMTGYPDRTLNLRNR